MTKQDNKKRGYGGWLFLGTTLLLFGFVALRDFSLAEQSFHLFSKMLLQIVPALILVFCLMVLFNLLLTPEFVKKHLGIDSGLKAWVLAILVGIFSTGPIYSWYILLRELKQSGMKTSLMAVFLYSRAIKLPMLPMLVHYFGLTYAIILSLNLIIFSIFSGIITGLLSKNKLENMSKD